jgi:hypothetical protein
VRQRVRVGKNASPQATSARSKWSSETQTATSLVCPDAIEVTAAKGHEWKSPHIDRTQS